MSGVSCSTLIALGSVLELISRCMINLFLAFALMVLLGLLYRVHIAGKCRVFRLSSKEHFKCQYVALLLTYTVEIVEANSVREMRPRSAS